MFSTRFAPFKIVFLLASIVLASLVVAAEPKTKAGRIEVGDLAEYTSGMGPMVGEVISAPDASNYYLLLVPTEEQVPINGTKLRLIQRAGAAKAPFNPGDVVDVRGNGNMVHRASVVKVNGGGCQVKAQGMVGWGECKKLRVVQQGTKPQGAAQADTE